MWYLAPVALGAVTARTLAIMGWTAAASLLFVACDDEDACSRFTETCIGLELRSPPGESLSVNQVGFLGVEGFAFGGGLEARSPVVAREVAAALPVRVPVLPPPQFAGGFVLAVRGLVGGSTVGEAEIGGSIGLGQHLSMVAILEPPGGAPPDLGGIDLLGRDFSRADLARAADDLAGPTDLAGSRLCDPFQQNCPAGEQCSVPGGILPGDEVCLPDGTIVVGASCDPDSGARCEKSALCLADSSAGFDRICRQMCDVQFDEYCTLPPGPGSSKNAPHCQQIELGTSIGLCTLPCNPVTAAGASGCPAGSRCFYQPRVLAEITDCNTIDGTLTDGAACTRVVDCAPGFGCMQVGATSSYACREVCRYPMSSDCHTPGYLCTRMPFYAAPLFGFCCPSTGC
jgi:hypothetical protein